MLKWITFKHLEGTDNVIQEENKTIFNYSCTNPHQCSPYEVYLQAGQYLFELWGSQGGDARLSDDIELIKNTGGRGAFVSGLLTLKKPQKFFFYVGSKGQSQASTLSGSVSKGGYNGGAAGGRDLYNTGSSLKSSAGGGGSSDVRLVKDNGENSFESLKSRIIVAGAGGGACSVLGHPDANCEYTIGTDDLLCNNKNDNIRVSPYGGAAGALHGYRANTITYPGNQTKGYFGSGMTGASLDEINAKQGGSIGGGGSGYFGGTISTAFLSQIQTMAGGAGGSSYVSGCEGCRSIAKDSETNETIDEPIHYSGLLFTNIQMQSGLQEFLSPSGERETGHSGNGAISITVNYYIPSITNSPHRYLDSLRNKLQAHVML